MGGKGGRRSAAPGLLSVILLSISAATIAYPLSPSSPPDRVGARSVPRTAQQRQSLAYADSLWTAGHLDSYWSRAGVELATARLNGDSILVGDLLAHRGQARARLGMILQAEPDLRGAIRITEFEGNTRNLRACVRWMAYALGRQGRNVEAMGFWERLLDLSLKDGDRFHEGWARVGMAFLMWQEGSAKEAGEAYERARSIFKNENEPRGEAFAMNGLGTVAQALGHYAAAEEWYRQAAAVARGCDWKWTEALAWNNIAVLLYSLGDPGQARVLFGLALDLHREAGDMAEVALTEENIAQCDAALGLFEQGIEDLMRLRRECRERGILELDGKLCNALAGIQTKRGRFNNAAGLYRETLAQAEAVGATTRRSAALGLAHCLVEMDSVAQARDLLVDAFLWFHEGGPLDEIEYELALGRCDMIAGRPATALPVLAAAEAKARRLGQPSVQIRALSAQAQAAHGLSMPDSALACFGRALSIWTMERGLPADPQWREVRGAAVAEIVPGMGSVILDHPAGRPPAQRARTAFDAVQLYKARTLMERMHGPAGEETPALDIAAVRCADLQESVLRPGELLLDYYLATDSSLVFAVDKEKCRAYRIAPRGVIEAALLPYLRMVSEPPGHRSESDEAAAARDLEDVSRRVRTMLLGPILDLVQSHRNLIVIPDGILDRLSFAVLLESSPDLTREPIRPVQVAPSATILAQLRGESREDARGTEPCALLALAGPDSGGRGMEARMEVADLAARFRGVRRGPFSAAGSSAPHDVLHIAAHATVDEDHPWCARIDLGGEDSTGRSHAMAASDLIHSKRSARLVVLSACNSAGGRLLPGEGVQSLASAFLVSGAPAVVASLWPVDGRDTRRLMGRFYGGLADGLTVAEALARSQAEMRSEPGGLHPFRWAGFIVLGDGNLHVPLERRLPLERFALPGALFLAGAAALIGPPLHRRLRQRARNGDSVVISENGIRLPDGTGS